jgi:MFS family permease
VIGVPLVAFFIVQFGWRWGFGITAILSLAYFAAYWLIYRDPSEDSRLSGQEHNYILAGGATPEGRPPAGQGVMLAYVLRNRKVWAHTIGYSAYGYSFYLFLTWLPGYLVQSLHMSILKSAGFAAIPWMFATLADLLIGGFFVDWLLQRGLDETKVRKAVIVSGMVGGLAVFGAVYTTDPFWALTWITISLSGLSAAAPVASSVVSLISPRGGTATVGGFANLINNLMGVAAPVITGFIVGVTHSFAGAFLVAGIVLLVGIFSYVVLLGPIEPIPEPPAQAT